MASHVRQIRTAALAALLAGFVASPAAAQSAFVLRGTIRDFKAEHPDFGPDVPVGHYPGSVAFTAAADGAPVFAGGGYEALTQWRDRLGRPIAPHLWNEGLVYVQVATSPELSPGTVADSYDADAGPYNPLTAGPAPEWLVGSPMPSITAPTLGGPVVPTFSRSGAGTTVISSDMRCGTFDVRDLHTVRISGEVRIVVDTNFVMRDGAKIVLDPGAQLDLYTKGTAGVYDTTLGGAEQTDRLRIYHLGSTELRFGDASQVYAHVTSPSAGVKLQDGSQMYGKITAYTVKLENSSGLHIDDIPTQCGITIDDSRGSAGGAGGGITSAATFGQWFEDLLGVNASRPHHLVMRDSSGTYQHTDDAFLPIDGKLYGNEGDAHNYYFTYDAPATFTYEACAGQTIRFEGSDDCWIFIDNQLIIDLGGVEAGTPQVCELDRLRLVDGETYSFRLFYAHRHAGPARFSLQTNFELAPADVVSGIAAYPAHD
jgi:fibro-slime domain-containing protein